MAVIISDGFDAKEYRQTSGREGTSTGNVKGNIHIGQGVKLHTVIAIKQ